MTHSFRRKGALTITLLVTLSLTACGTILYPERKGQTGGRIDPGVAVLDGVGLLAFLIPGVIAFAVDFSNGTIYLPGGRRSHLTENQLQQIRTGKMKPAALASDVLHRQVAANKVIVRRAADLQDARHWLALQSGAMPQG